MRTEQQPWRRQTPRGGRRMHGAQDLQAPAEARAQPHPLSPVRLLADGRRTRKRSRRSTNEIGACLRDVERDAEHDAEVDELLAQGLGGEQLHLPGGQIRRVEVAHDGVHRVPIRNTTPCGRAAWSEDLEQAAALWIKIQSLRVEVAYGGEILGARNWSAGGGEQGGKGRRRRRRSGAGPATGMEKATVLTAPTGSSEREKAVRRRESGREGERVNLKNRKIL